MRAISRIGAKNPGKNRLFETVRTRNSRIEEHSTASGECRTAARWAPNQKASDATPATMEAPVSGKPIPGTEDKLTCNPKYQLE